MPRGHVWSQDGGQGVNLCVKVCRWLGREGEGSILMREGGREGGEGRGGEGRGGEGRGGEGRGGEGGRGGEEGERERMGIGYCANWGLYINLGG